MIRTLLLATTILASPAIAAAQSCTSTASGAGSFHVANGQIIGPNGQPFIAKGVAIYGDVDLPVALANIAKDLPGINFLRITNFNLSETTAAYLAPFVQQLRSLGIVVELQDTNYPQVLTGSDLAAAEQWYASLATTFAGDPGVWFDTQNEPTGGDVTDDQNEIVGIYNAIRATGNNSIIMMDPGGNTIPGMNPAAFAKMTNVVWDEHYYNWESGYSTDVSTNQAKLSSDIATFQSITSADGTIPAVVGEYGNSTDGSNVDPGGLQTVQAVQQSGYGSVAWEWYNSGTTADAVMTSQGGGTLNGTYGQMVAQFISTSCGGVLPPALTASIAANTPAQQQSSTTQGQQQEPASPPSDSTVDFSAPQLPADPGPQTLAQQSPQGTSPDLAPPSSGTNNLTAAGYASLSGDVGNNNITVTSDGNVVSETTGQEVVQVTGDYNAVELGPYDDSVTVSGAGNVVNAGGGTNTITIQPPPASSATSVAQLSSVQVDATSGARTTSDNPNAVAQIGGNIIILPSPGTGEDIINGTLGALDRLDLTQSLSGTTWDHTMSSILNYVTISSAVTGGTTISVGGTVVAVLNNPPSRDFMSYVVAH